MRGLIMAASALLLLAACDDEMRLPVQEAAGDVSADYCGVEEIFVASCAQCHGEGAGTDPVLVDPSDLVGVESDGYAGSIFVVAGDAGGSFIFQKVAGEQGDKGSTMPLSGDALSENNLSAIEAWIDDGATTDCEAR